MGWVTRVMPRSLRGQVLLAVILALLAAQAVSAALLLNAAESRRDAAMLNAAALQLVRQDAPRADNAGDSRAEDRAAARRDRRDREQRDRLRSARQAQQDHGRRLERFGPRMARPLRLEWTTGPVLLAGETRDADRERELAAVLGTQGVDPVAVRVTSRTADSDPYIASRPRLAERFTREQAWQRPVLVAAIQRQEGGPWAVARVPMPDREPTVQRTIFVQTLVLFAVLALALWLLLRRITRPLAELTARTEAFARTRQPGEPLAEAGPDDVRHLIAAHNTMQARIAALLQEKDMMLGAIGHDLKTPLAALRVRIEGVSDERQRSRMAATIEDMAATLDDILMLARAGRASEPREPTDLTALAAMVVSEFEDLGEPAELADGARVVAPVQPSWLRRALRNLVANAVRYGGGAQVTVLSQQGRGVLRVEDSGPGIPAERITAMLEPFARGEESRNRQTGGAGLGLAIARTIAEQHGGTLMLENRPEGGLRAEIRLPL